MGEIWNERSYNLLWEKVSFELKKDKNWLKTKEFEKWSDSFSDTIGAKSNKAILNQINWGLTKQETIGSTNIKIYITNKFYAFKYGVDKIDRTIVPKYILSEKKVKK